jgi:hypothetical protein
MYASVGDIGGVEIRLVGVSFVLWLNRRGHGVGVVVVDQEYEEGRSSYCKEIGKPRPYQHVCEVQVTPELFHVSHEAVLEV